MSLSSEAGGFAGQPEYIQASDSWQVLLTHLEYHVGFAFALLLLPDPGISGLCRELLVQHLATFGKGLVDASPRSVAECMELSSNLALLRTTEETDIVWVELPISELDLDFTAWSQAIHQAFAQINSIRNLLQQQIGCTLLFAAPAWLQPVIRTMAPDLWSIRSLVVQIEPPQSTASGGKQRSESPSAADDSPDPYFALEQAAAMRGQPGQELALYNALYRAGLGFLRMGQLEEAQSALRESLALCERSSLPAGSVAAAELVLAESLAKGGHPELETRQLFESAIARLRAANASAPLADALRKYGDFLLSGRNYAEAAQVLSDAMNLSRSSGDELGFANDAALLGIALWYQRDLQGARNLEEQVVEIRRRMLGSEHPNTLAAMHNLARTLFDQGDLTGALRLDEQTLEVRRRTLGDEHPNTLSSMHTLAQDLTNLGDYAEARRLNEHVLEIRRRTLGDEHVNTLASMNNLARNLSLLKDYAEARRLNEHVLEVRRRTLGEEHPDTLTSMNNLARDLSLLGEHAEARRLDEQVLQLRRKILGEEHPNTLLSMSNLAGDLWDEEDFPGAKALEEQVLRTTRRIFGGDHPSTLDSMGGLARTLWSQGELAEARVLEEQVLQARRRVLGEAHPDTLLAMENLARTLDDSGDAAGARALEEELHRIRSENANMERTDRSAKEMGSVERSQTLEYPDTDTS